MANPPNPDAVLSQVSAYIQKVDTQKPPRPLVIMSCGIAGSGKSTLSHTILSAYPAMNFTRLSVDQIIYSQHRVCGLDYPCSEHAAYADEAHAQLLARLPVLLRENQNVILDLSLWSRADRDSHKGLISQNGGRWLLIYFDAEQKRELLWARIQKRRAEGVESDTMFDVTEDVLDRYVAGFERPEGEGEIVVDVV